MACCAFAAFLLMQLLAPFVWVRDRLFGARVNPAAGAAAWMPGAAAPAVRPAGALTWRRGLLYAAAVEVALLAAGYQVLRPDPAAADRMTLTEALHASWCGSAPPDFRSSWGK